MNTILSEKEYQTYIIDKLKTNNGYLVRDARHYNRLYATDDELVIQFLDDTQPKQMEKLRKIYKEDTEQIIISQINTLATQKNGSLLDVLKHGIELSNTHLDLMYIKPATDFNKELNEKYSKNIFSVMEEVCISDKERIDLVIFLNGLAIMSFELKCEMAGQTYEDAISQYRTQRDPKNRLFLFKAGTLVNFAMDLNEVYMATKLDGTSTYFLPFNKGNGVGINAGKGNPVYDDKFPVYYMWDEILQKDLVIELISKFIFIEVSEKEDENGKKTKKETIIFPRYHQLDSIRKTLADVVENETSLNYLYEMAAGSGKTNIIAWLAHRLSSLHTKDNRNIFDNIIIITDRVVVDRQLQDAVRRLEHQAGFIKVMNDKCTSADLAKALEGNTKIIATTIHKFLYIQDIIGKLKGKKFAVIIDEAHSSTSGKDMAAVTKALGDNVDYEDDAFNMDAEDIIVSEIAKTGKQKNVSMFAFTATPKNTTLQIFGKENTKGQREPFYVYSMKQAIEEGFILDVLQSYTTYKTFYKINKEVEDDPSFKNMAAKRQIARFVSLHDSNIGQRVEIIIEHFRQNVMQELNGQAKAMVITSSRAEAVKYQKAFEDYIDRRGYKNIRSLVAFSGKVAGKSVDKVYEGTEFSESSLNGFHEDKTPDMFDTDDYQVLIVANKYQTGFDQPKLCAMYVLKKLNGINAVQTLSRLNRICPPFDKKVFVLDFMNTIEDIEDAFKPYYTSTLLINTVNKQSVFDLLDKVDNYGIIDDDDVLEFADALYSKDDNTKKKTIINGCLQRSKKNFEKLNETTQKECYLTLRKFIRFYEFLILVTTFNDPDVHKKYKYIDYLISYLRVSSSGQGFDLTDKIKADGFYQKKQGTKSGKVESNPEVKLPMTEINLTEDETKKLSEIIAEVNSKVGKNYDKEVAVKSMLQIKDILLKSSDLKASALANTENDFEFSFFDNIDEALIEGLEQNKDFFTLLLNNKEIKEEVLGIFAQELYRTFRKESREDGKAKD
ncbi:MAG: DEAD/DEAH box helicase family protein [Erysipelotrichaceae bacterium]|nr:DEAD/DEAH box helicase family protein [Erysipelotrichaceae bacterium]